MHFTLPCDNTVIYYIFGFLELYYSIFNNYRPLEFMNYKYSNPTKNKHKNKEKTILMSQINKINTQNELLMKNLMEFYKIPFIVSLDNNQTYFCKDCPQNGEITEPCSPNFKKMIQIVNGDENISLRIVDWFVTNYAKKFYTVYNISVDNPTRFKVYNDYKLKLKAYSKRRFDVFCRWERIQVIYDKEKYMETTIGQLNFFKWAIENEIIEFIKNNYKMIENDMNTRNILSKKNSSSTSTDTTSSTISSSSNASVGSTKTRKKREELSVSACRTIKKEIVNVVMRFS